MPKMDLRQNYRRGGVLYRAGKGVDVSDAVARWILGKDQPATVAETGSGAESGGESGAEGLPADYLYRDILAPKYTSHEAVQAASDEELLALDGIGPARLRELRAFKPA